MRCDIVKRFNNEDCGVKSRNPYILSQTPRQWWPPQSQYFAIKRRKKVEEPHSVIESWVKRWTEPDVRNTKERRTSKTEQK